MDDTVDVAIVDVDRVAISAVVVADVALAASGVAPPKAHKYVATLEAPVISAEYLHGGIVLLAVAVVSF